MNDALLVAAIDGPNTVMLPVRKAVCATTRVAAVVLNAALNLIDCGLEKKVTARIPRKRKRTDATGPSTDGMYPARLLCMVLR